MKATNRLAVEFEDYPQAQSAWSAPIRGQVEAQLEELKRNLLQPRMENITDTKLARELSWAAHEATALAWFTPYPMLVLPTLFEEKATAAVKRWEKQEQLRRRY